jgi:hypothetical protein
VARDKPNKQNKKNIKKGEIIPVLKRHAMKM